MERSRGKSVTTNRSLDLMFQHSQEQEHITYKMEAYESKMRRAQELKTMK